MTWSILLLLLIPAVAAHHAPSRSDLHDLLGSPPDPTTTSASAPVGVPVLVDARDAIDLVTGLVTGAPDPLTLLPGPDDLPGPETLPGNDTDLPCLVPFQIVERPGEDPRYFLVYQSSCYHGVWRTLDWDPLHLTWVILNSGPEEWKGLVEAEAEYLVERAQNATSGP